jgi:hypothetical protein
MIDAFRLQFTEKAEQELLALENDRAQLRHFKAVAKCLYFMQTI